MPNSKDYLDISIKAIEHFANDGKLDAEELSELLSLAERDGIIDDDEKRVLKNVISRIKPDEIDDAMQAQLEEIFVKLDG